MENTYTALSPRNKPRHFAFGLVILVFSTLLSTSAFLAYSASRIPPRSSPNPVIHPTVVYSPFTLHRGNISQAAEEPLGIPIYAGAVPSLLSTFAWRIEDPSAQPTSAGLVVVRFESKAPLSSVSSWYSQNFPKPYSQLRKEQILAGPAKEKWFQKLDAAIDNNIVLYQAVNSSEALGVVLQSSANSESTGITLFRYSEGR